MQPGKILRNHYKIIQLLGSGGFGDTYLAEDLDLPDLPGNPRPKCVVKHLSPKTSDPGVLPIAQRLFDREAKTLYKLGSDSDQIPKLFAHFQEGTEFYLVQEYIEGQDISKELTPGKKLSESYTIALLKGILSALETAHQNNIIHRDIKPQNLMRRKSDNKIVLIDFGAVKEISVLTTNPQGLTTLTIGVGTPGYMPSEQSNGKPKLSSDIYAVGMVGIKALTGQNLGNLPTDPDTENIIWRNEAQVSDRLANILDKMVREYFRERYQNATEALDALREIVNQSKPIPTPIVNQHKTIPTPISTTEIPPIVNQPKPKPTPIVNQHKTKPTPKRTIPSPPQPNKSRRKILILGGLAASGFVGALLSKDWWDSRFLQPEVNLSDSSQPKANWAHSSNLTQKFETVTVNAKGEIINRSPGQAEVMIENFDNGVSLEMVKIPAGRFLMGSPEIEVGRNDNESPQHNVDVPEFFMGKYPVTQAQWQTVMGNNPSWFKGANRSVEEVSWNEATEFCQKLSRITGKKYSLPSESQWEYACRAGTTTPFYFGETITSELVNFDGNSTYANAPKGIYREETTDVGIFPPNAFGLYDMHGNVLEWCQDVWHSNYNGAPTDGSAWETGGNNSRSPLRGGSWAINPYLCRSAYRDNLDRRGYNGTYIGFRIVCVGGRTF
ncbi:bifunctional serine/threonine-protein kinase/formylglycine-generating enzyme family protein [Okeania sp. SIO3I5]|uniref:bifunctional serine/threonine-protein kinase/formylglycine-generating enzyme family protein n=1 Tax=Okeania sp. SIO3I5 TaxID=2607805 RepID=UPI0025D96519|nr:SUMF1/EgtB/PvdO family nonheme iron enzyme [Okeania sp. SIO3I5]